jgi:hypothetical protein
MAIACRRLVEFARPTAHEEMHVALGEQRRTRRFARLPYSYIDSGQVAAAWIGGRPASRSGTLRRGIAVQMVFRRPPRSSE